MNAEKTIEKFDREDSENLEHKMAKSNGLKKKKTKQGYLSNFRVIPKIEIIGKIYDGEKGDESSSSNITRGIDHKNRPFISNENITEPSKTYDDKLIYCTKKPKNINELTNLDGFEKFLIDSQEDDKYYVCRMRYDFIANLSIGSLYNEDIILAENESDFSSLSTHKPDDHIEYKIGEDGINIRSKSGIAQVFEPFDYWLIILYAILLDTALLCSIFAVDPHIVPPLLLLFIALIPLILPTVGYFMSGMLTKNHTKSVDQYKDEYDIFEDDKVVINYNDFDKEYKPETEYMNSTKLQEEVTIKTDLENGRIHCKNRDIVWSITHDSEILTNEAIKFYSEMDLEYVQDEFHTTIVRCDGNYDPHIYLVSECGDWMLLPSGYGILQE